MKQLRNVLTHLLNGLAASFWPWSFLTCWQVVATVSAAKSLLLVRGAGVLPVRLDEDTCWDSLVTTERGHMNIPVIVELPGVQNGISVFAELVAFGLLRRHPGVRRRSDHQSGHGTDDLPRGCHLLHRRALHRAGVLPLWL